MKEILWKKKVSSRWPLNLCTTLFYFLLKWSCMYRTSDLWANIYILSLILSCTFDHLKPTHSTLLDVIKILIELNACKVTRICPVGVFHTIYFWCHHMKIQVYFMCVWLWLCICYLVCGLICSDIIPQLSNKP